MCELNRYTSFITSYLPVQLLIDLTNFQWLHLPVPEYICPCDNRCPVTDIWWQLFESILNKQLHNVLMHITYWIHHSLYPLLIYLKVFILMNVTKAKNPSLSSVMAGDLCVVEFTGQVKGLTCRMSVHQ